ncbi:MAG: metallophosphoesterase [Eubacteriales bacterium]
MKLLFVHLSDIHIDQSFQVNSTKTTKFIDAVKSDLKNVDHCVVICSGDIAKTAHINEYRVAKMFLGKIQSELGETINGYVNLLIVPGNHDLDLSYNKRDFEIINNYYKNGTVDREYKNELNRNKNFFDYAKSKKCFNDSSVISNKILTFGTKKIIVNLINSSPFSTLDPNDKELHYLPSDEMIKLNKHDDADLTISIVHHSPECFNSESRLELKTLLYENSDIVFWGHDHVAGTEDVTKMSSCTVHISRGGEYSGLYSNTSKFLTMLYDTESNEYAEHIFTWNPTNLIFTEDFTDNKVLKVGNASICNREEFTKAFYEDKQGLKDSCLDYFVFPMLKIKSNEYEKGNEDKILSKEEFLKSIEECNIVHIVAPEDYGKSTLLKYLYRHYQETGFAPLYFSEESYHKKKDRIIEYMFDEQYNSENNRFDKYRQLDVSKKIILMDNIDKLRSNVERTNLLDYFGDNFSTIIFTSTKKENVDVLSAIEETFESKYKIKTYELESFYLRKRNNLIENVCKSFGVSDSDTIFSLTEIINNLIDKNFDMFELSPSTLIHYIKYFVSQDDDARKKDVVFYEIFGNNIINILREKISDVDIQEYLIQLEELAYYMHFSSTPVICSEDLHECFKIYDEEWGSTISTNEMINKLVECKILSNGFKINYYRFTNNNYFAYFVARKINRDINNNSNLDSVYYLAKNICFTINDKILMFLADIRNNTSFILNLCDQLDDIMDGFVEIDFDNPNIQLFNRMNQDDIHIATESEKDRIDEKKENEEIKHNKDKFDEIGFVKEYEYTEDDVNNIGNRLNRAYKYMEMISKSYASQFSILKKSEKEKILKILLTIPNKLTYAMLKPLDDKFDKVAEATYQMALKLDIDDVDKEEIEDMIVDLARAMTLSLYDSISFDCTTKKTMRYMSTINCDSISNKIQKLMMIGFSNGTNAFIEESIDLLHKYPSNVIVQTFVKLIVRVHIIRRKKLDHKQIAKISEEIFYSADKKEIFRLLLK